MSEITQIQQDNKTRRILVYIDNRYCTSIRPNVWDAMGLKEGDEITCAELHQKERNAYHKCRKENYSDFNKQTVNRVVRWFDKYIPAIEAKIIDFKFDDNEYDYPHYRYDQNISLFLKGTNKELITLEVACVELQRGVHNWVLADKVMFAQSQSKRDGWAVLYYKYPVERLIWVKPDPRIIYKTEEIIKGSKRQFIFFKNDSPEVYSSPKFFDYIQNKINSRISDASSSKCNSQSLDTNHNASLSPSLRAYASQANRSSNITNTKRDNNNAPYKG